MSLSEFLELTDRTRREVKSLRKAWQRQLDNADEDIFTTEGYMTVIQLLDGILEVMDEDDE